MRRSDTLNGVLDNLEHHEEQLNIQYRNLKSAGHLSPDIPTVISALLDNRNRTKRLLRIIREKIKR